MDSQGNSLKASDQGHFIYEQVFHRTEMGHVAEALAAASVERTKAGARHVLKLPAVRALATDSRLMDIAREFVGPTPVAFRATLFDKSPVANWLVAWHQDTALPLCHRFDRAGWGPWSTKAGVLYAHAPAWALERIVALRVSSMTRRRRTAHSEYCRILTALVCSPTGRSRNWLEWRRLLTASRRLAASWQCVR